MEEQQSQQNNAGQQKGRNQNRQKNFSQEPDINQLLKVRREKLAELQEAGKDPFQITKYDVTIHSRTYDVQTGDGQSLFL